MGNFHTGVYGDHSSDGWLEWGLERHFAEIRAEREAKGDFGATDEVKMAIEWVDRAEHTGHLDRATYHMQKAGMLAVKEALFGGKIINGWDDVEPNFDRAYNRGGWPLHHMDELPDEYQAVANLADNPRLRKIRDTGSRLIPADREIRFARERVAEANRALKEEQEQLDNLGD